MCVMATTTSVYVDPNTGGVQAGLMQFRNKIINGNFDVWQRGTTFSPGGTYAYTADRWFVDFDGGGATRTVSQQAFTNGQTDVPGMSRYYIRFNQSVAGSTGSFTGLTQRIESVLTGAGRTVTTSFYAKSDVSRVMVIILGQNFGTGGSPSGTLFYSKSITLSTVWQKYSVSHNISSISGKTIGTNNNDFLAVQFGGTANAIQTIDIAQVQLEEGQQATPFEMRPYPVELQLCQRYYEVGPLIGRWTFTTTTSGRIYIQCLVQKRSNVTFTLSPPNALTSNEASGIANGRFNTVTTINVGTTLTNPLGILADFTSSTVNAAGVLDLFSGLPLWTLNAEL